MTWLNLVAAMFLFLIYNTINYSVTIKDGYAPYSLMDWTDWWTFFFVMAVYFLYALSWLGFWGLSKLKDQYFDEYVTEYKQLTLVVLP